MRPKEFFKEVRETFNDTLYCGLIVEDEVYYDHQVDGLDSESYESIVMRLYFLATDPEKKIDYFITQYQEDKYLYINKVSEGVWIFIFSGNRSFAKLHFFVQFILSEDQFELESPESDDLDHYTENEAKIMSARRIQELLMPNLNLSLQAFKQHHVWYKPKDLVGGDFYWTRQTKKHLWVIAGDCTGHSVEGALASVSVMSILNQVFESDTQPHLLIKELYRSLNNLQEQKLEQGYGIGCEMIAMRFDFSKNELKYSGTGFPLYYFKQGRIQRNKTRKSALNPDRVVKYLRSRTIIFNSNDGFFTHSDGLLDQLNPMGKRIQSKFFMSALKSHKKVDDIITKDLVMNHLKGKQQTDDIVSLYMVV